MSEYVEIKADVCPKCGGGIGPGTIRDVAHFWCRCAVRRKPGRRWRVLAQGPGAARVDVQSAAPDRRPRDGVQIVRADFDELVVDDWLHVERMDHREWLIIIGGTGIAVSLPRDPRKPPQLTVHLDAWADFGEPCDTTPGGRGSSTEARRRCDPTWSRSGMRWTPRT